MELAKHAGCFTLSPVDAMFVLAAVNSREARSGAPLLLLAAAQKAAEQAAQGILSGRAAEHTPEDVAESP